MTGVQTCALPILTYDFTGIGTLDTNTTGVDTRRVQAYTGWVTIDVIAPGPSGRDSYIDSGNTLAFDHNGWVQSDFFIDWGNGSVSPAAMLGLTCSDMYAQVDNHPSFDGLINREYYSGTVGGITHLTSAQLTRAAMGTTAWLSDLSFDQSVGLAPGGSNSITFDDVFYTPTATGDVDYASLVGYSGYFNLSSLTIRTTSVPEPGTLALFGLGIAGLLGMARRRAST